MASPLTTYPGTVTPLRGLAPFIESERDVFFGRETERDAMTRLVTQDGVRACLLYGEPGVGKTSLLNAGLAPHLRDHGVVALTCDDMSQPTAGFSRAVATATSVSARSDEKPIDYLVRVVSQSMAGQVYVFVIDDIDVVMRHDLDGRIAHELGDLFARVTTRSSGRARFLFALADARLHWLDTMERRTGSLFPPNARYRLGRFTREQAHEVLLRTLALGGLGQDPLLPAAVSDGLADGGMILPADLQIAARALRDLNLESAAALSAAGGARELPARWVLAAASTSIDERRGMRVCGALAAHRGDEPVAMSADEVAAIAGVTSEVATSGLDGLVARGVAIHGAGPHGRQGYMLAHEILIPRVRELSAPARDGAARARALLASAAGSGTRLTPLELESVQREQVQPSTPAEASVMTAQQRRLYTIVGAAVAVPLFLMVLIYISLSGRYYLSTAGQGSAKRVVARAGRPGLSGFFWMPHSPGFGKVIGDSGFAQKIVDAKAWKQADRHDLGGKLGDNGTGGRRAFVSAALDGLQPPLRYLVRYALDPVGEAPLEELKKNMGDPARTVAMLDALSPIARGGDGEVALVGQALADASPAVQRAALGVALAAARRKPGSYRVLLGKAMAATDPDLRSRALAGARALGPEMEGELLAAALAQSPEPATRRDLLAAFSALPSATPAASGHVAVALLGGAGGQKLDPGSAEDAWHMLEGAFDRDASAATLATGKLVGDEAAGEDIRVRAIALIEKRAPAELSDQLAPEIEIASSSTSPKVSAAALPLYARVAPDAAARKLVSFTDPPVPVRVAIAGAWGELARKRADAAQQSLDALLADKAPTVRAAAARAYGRLGKPALDKLTKITKSEGGDVAEGAAWGLAAAVEAGASPAEASAGIGQLWKKKGEAKREAARIYTHLCKIKPNAFVSYAASAARDTEDATLGPIGVDGLCNAIEAGAAKAALPGLKTASEGASVPARTRVAVCLARNPDLGENGLKIALKFAEDSEPTIRLDAARALGAMAKSAKTPKQLAGALAKLLGDPDRGVRLAAAVSLKQLAQGSDQVSQSLQTAWDKADEGEKLVLVDVAQAVGEAELIAAAARDPSSTVRARALGAAAVVKKGLPAILGAALGDSDPTVRAEALRLVADPASGLRAADAASSLELAITGDDASAAEAALTALAGVDEPERVLARLTIELGSPVDAVRARAARAAWALAARPGSGAGKLIEPLLADPSHDVRVAAVAALAADWAVSASAADLGKKLRGAEANALIRLVALDALLYQAHTDKRADVDAELSRSSRGGAPPFAALFASLGAALLATGADGPAFVALLVP
jgi:hypothetical protein